MRRDEGQLVYENKTLISLAVADRTDTWRVRSQLWTLSDWNQWTEVLTVTRWICQRPMMTSTCTGINSSLWC